MSILATISVIAETAIKVAEGIRLVGVALDAIRTMVNAFVDVCKAFGLVDESVLPEDLGNKALQAEEFDIIPEKFNNYKEYVEAVEKFELDPLKTIEFREEDLLLKASELFAGLIQERMSGVDLDGFSSAMSTMSPERIAAIIKTLKDGTCDTFNNIIGVINNEKQDPDLEKTENGIKGLAYIEKQLNPELSDKEAIKKAMNDLRKG